MKKPFKPDKFFNSCFKTLIELEEGYNFNRRPTVTLGINVFNEIRAKHPDDLKNPDIYIVVRDSNKRYKYNPETDKLEKLK